MTGFAEDALAGAVARRQVRSVVIKDAEAFEALTDQLRLALTRAWTRRMREGTIEALDRLREMGPGAFTPDDGAEIVAVLERSVGPEAIRSAMRDPVLNLSDALFRLGATEVGEAAGIDIAFQRPDRDAMDALKRGNVMWTGHSWTAQTQGRLEAIMDAYFEEGWARDQLSARMAEDFADATDRSAAYWDVLADTTASRTREIGRVTGYERAGVARVRVRAQLDESTTPICRQMHGRVIEVGRLRAQAEAYIAASDPPDLDAAKRAWVMHGDAADLTDIPDDALPRGTAGPPYHFRCRTITVAEF
jgi:hypothetical protein